MSTSEPTATAVTAYVETGQRRVFACALEWPGWCRSGKDEDQALSALLAYAPRYAVAAREAGVPFPAGVRTVRVVEHLAGSAATDFGVPEATAVRDARRTTRAEADRQCSLVAAAWRVLERVVASAPSELRKGPRGGGRDRDAIAQHVLSAEAAYARKLGVNRKEPQLGDDAAVEELRRSMLDVLGRPSDGEPVVERGWRPRYAARRIAWHALDHAWEIEDRREP
jgi:hypothetical protein